jgi:hypothetical protein
MVIQPGVELTEPGGGRHVKGDSIMTHGRLKMSDYKQMVNDPRTYQNASELANPKKA